MTAPAHMQGWTGPPAKPDETSMPHCGSAGASLVKCFAKLNFLRAAFRYALGDISTVGSAPTQLLKPCWAEQGCLASASIPDPAALYFEPSLGTILRHTGASPAGLSKRARGAALATQVSQLSSRIDRELTRTLREFVRMRTVSCDPRLRDDCFKGAMYLAHMLEALGAEIKISRCGLGRSRFPAWLRCHAGRASAFESATCSGMGLSRQTPDKSHRESQGSCMQAKQSSKLLELQQLQPSLGYVGPHHLVLQTAGKAAEALSSGCAGRWRTRTPS